MLKNFFVAAIVSLVICVGVKVEAAEIFVGNSPATGYDCYVLTDSIGHKNEHRMLITFATLKMVDGYGNAQYLDYTFFDLDGNFVDVEFSNSQGFAGKATAKDTPIEWAMYTVIREY